MTRYITVALVLCGCVLLASAQYNNFGFGYNSYLATNFGPPGLGGLSAAAARDSRSNRGPVVFPPSPTSDASQSSGVVIGASGYGFEAPNSQGAPKGSRCRSCVVYDRKPTYVQYSEGIIEQRRLLAYLDWIRNIRFDRGYIISNPWSKFSRYIPDSYI